MGALQLNEDFRMIDLAAPERSQPSRSGGAAHSMRAAASPAPDPEVVAKAQRRKFTAYAERTIVEGAGPVAIGALCQRRCNNPQGAGRKFSTPWLARGRCARSEPRPGPWR